MSFYLQMEGVYLSLERLVSCFLGDRQEGQSVPLALAIFKVTLIQNDQYATMIHFGVAHPELQQIGSLKGREAS